MSKDYLLGIDIGTSACKVAIFNKNGKVMASANGDYPVYYPHEGWAQQKPDEWWHAVCGAICECLETGNISGEQIAGVGIDGQSWSAIAIDHEGNVLTDTPIWMDTRDQEICGAGNERHALVGVVRPAINRYQNGRCDDHKNDGVENACADSWPEADVLKILGLH